VSVNLFECILTAVVCSAALCIQLRSNLRNWFVQQQFSPSFQFFDQEVNYFYQTNTWKNSLMHIQLATLT